MGAFLSRQTERSVEPPTYTGHSRVGVRNRGHAWIQPFSAEATEVRAEPPPDDSKLLKVLNVDLNITLNTERHKTSEYDITETVNGQTAQLVIRRGQSFDIDIKFNRVFDKEEDDIRLVFEIGSNPAPHKATHVEVVLSDSDRYRHWGARILGTDKTSLTIRVYTPPTLFVGKWSLKIDVIKRDDVHNVVYRHNHDQSIYILFNPWSKDDTTYIHEEDLLEEYVLADTGIIYQGTAPRPTAKPWNFAQFDSVVLDCGLMALELSKLPITSRGDPIHVVRKLSAITNAQDDNGILVGDWSGEYVGGTLPSKWAGSLAILQQYYDTKAPVFYGQCWVFAGVVTTLCRTLGIPSRCVTNFSSAHDVDGSITVDKFWEYANPGYKPLEEYNSDSIWNFHVWNEAWMSRPDLPTGYGGWQAIDSTPQETSDGIFCCGPMSVIAIQHGDVNLPYDGPFVFAEINADKVHWVRQENGTFRKAALDKRSIGRNVSTYLPRCRKTDSACDDREDITDQYKFKEGSKAERTSVIAANIRGSSRDDIYIVTDKNDVTFELASLDSVNYGSDVELSINITNGSSENRTIDGFMCTNTTYYTGVAYKNIKEHAIKDIEIEPGQSKDVKLTVSVEEYLNNLIDHCNFHVACACCVRETNQIFTAQDCFCLDKPELTIKAPEKAKVGEKINVEISFVNPLPVTLTHCELRVEGPGLQRCLMLPHRNVEKNDTFMSAVELVPAKKGVRRIIANFNATELYGIMGYFSILVEGQ